LEIIKNTKIHILALLIVIVCEFIGIIRIPLGQFSIVFFPMLFAMVIGGIISYPKWKALQEKEMQNASNMLTTVLILLITAIGLTIGPNLPRLMDAKLALLMQEFGHFFGTILLGLPLAVALGMKREAIGATYSLDREGNIAIIAEKYGLNSPEGHGVMAMYICGTVFGAVWIGIFASAIASLDIFHPFALAMGAGVGSGSMLAAASGVIAEFYPALQEQILAYAGAANLMTGILGIYFALFISLPITVKCYGFLNRLLGREEIKEGA